VTLQVESRESDTPPANALTKQVGGTRKPEPAMEKLSTATWRMQDEGNSKKMASSNLEIFWQRKKTNICERKKGGQIAAVPRGKLSQLGKKGRITSQTSSRPGKGEQEGKRRLRGTRGSD